MSAENRAIAQNGGGSPAGEGAGAGDKLNSIATSIDAIKGVVGDLVTKVSDIERSVQERQDLAEIMRSVNPPADYEDMSRFERQAPTAKNGEPPKAEEIVGRLESTLKKNLDTINRRIDDVVAQFEVKRLEADPEFNTKVRPVAYKLSQEPDLKGLGVERLTKIAKGELALKQNQEYEKQLSEMKAKVEELELRAQGDKPGMFVGIQEPPKKMTADEAFEDAFKKSGADRLIR